MRELYDALPKKPEWLTAEAIDRYAAQMAAPYQVAAYHHFENGFDDMPLPVNPRSQRSTRRLWSSAVSTPH